MHTPGPWLIAQANGPLLIQHAGSQGRVCTIADNSQDQRIACANACLIAAAPALLAALESAYTYLQAHVPKGNVRKIYSELVKHACVTKEVHFALAKAKGVQP